MDEIEEDDLNELESRLYAQIHHEAVQTDNNQMVLSKQTDEQYMLSPEHIFNKFSAENNLVKKDLKAATSSQEKLVYNAPTNDAFVNANTSDKQICTSNADAVCADAISNANKLQKIKSNNSTIQHRNTTNDNSTCKFKNSNKSFNAAHPNLILNPAKFSKQNQQQKKKQQKKEKTKNAPFDLQLQKLEKCKRAAAKKQKSTEVRKKRNKKPVVECETINLTLSDDDCNDDVEVVLLPSPPIFTIEDSDDDNTNNTKENIFNIEENALDAADIDMTIKNTKSTANTTTETEELQKHKENRSRCNSPCSVQSADDFIGVSKRKNLKSTNTEQANDEDLLLLIADVDSSMDTASISRAPKIQANIDLCQTKKNIHTSASSNKSNSTEFLVPTPTTANQSNFCVREKQFRAIDIYESESDLNDGVYCKGLRNPTIVREIGSTDDESVEPINITAKAKRLRKRRSSSCNKDLETNNSDSSDLEADNNETTPVMGIVRGPAVETRLTKSIKKLSTKTTTKSNKSTIDNAFIETLNNLAQGGDAVESEDSVEETQEPTARDIAEKVLKNNMLQNKSDEQIVTVDTLSDVETITTANESAIIAAIPNDGSIDKLDKIFKAIDKMDQSTSLIEYNGSMDLTSDSEDVLVVDDLPNKQLNITQTDLKKKVKLNAIKPRYIVCDADTDKLWPVEMLKFYNCSWNGENFNIMQTYAKMRMHKDNWKINQLDRYPQSRALKKVKCFNCCEFGHLTSTCSRPKKPIVCYMCGESGHKEPRCPNTLCLRCGNKTLTFVKNCHACKFQDRMTCSLCQVRGHIVDNCPDKWRRYHSTTKPDMTLVSQLAYNNKKYCCICGRRGHLSEACKYHYMTGYPIGISKIKSYQKTYTDLTKKRSDGNIKVNLLYNPKKHISFRFKHHIKEFNCYARFLSAVGLGYMLKKKRCAKSTNAVQHKKIKLNSDAPDQVQEVSESGNIADAKSLTVEKNIHETHTPPIYVLTDEESWESIDVVSAHVNKVNLTNIASSEDEEMCETNNATKDTFVNIADSDSNYSFSEHFAGDHNAVSKNSLNIKNTEVSNTTTVSKSQQNNTAAQNATLNNLTSNTTNNEIVKQISANAFAPNAVTNQKTKSRPMDVLPDFIPLTSTSQKTNSRPMQTLPDYISLSLNTNEQDKELEYAPTTVSQKKRYFSTNNENVNTVEKIEESPSEVMVCVPTHLIKYFESKEGRLFLTETSKLHNVRVCLGNSSAGKSIFLFGLPSNQESFHSEMLKRFGNFQNDNKKQTDNSSNVPKRIEVLIKFLRENLNQLMNKLGNVNDLLNRMIYHESQGSKTSNKLAEKERRLLNMILLGQAGLRNGNKHLDNLLVILKKLIHEHNSEGTASEELRSEINFHWKLIFTSYRHSDYFELVKDYNRLSSTNRISKVNFDPVLLGNKVVDTSLTNQQKEQLEQLKPKVHSTNEDVIAENTKSANSKTQNFKIPQQTPISRMQTQDKAAINSTTKKQQQATSKLENANSTIKLNTSTQTKKQISIDPPFKKPEQKSTVSESLKKVSQNWQETCHNLLTKLDGSKNQSQNRLLDVSAASMFWSREAMKYLDECVILSESNNELLLKLKRVQNKSENGLLSYNDYRAIIKLHTAMTGK